MLGRLREAYIFQRGKEAWQKRFTLFSIKNINNSNVELSKDLATAFSGIHCYNPPWPTAMELDLN